MPTLVRVSPVLKSFTCTGLTVLMVGKALPPKEPALALRVRCADSIFGAQARTLGHTVSMLPIYFWWKKVISTVG
jgi:hypothetical protein